MVIGSWNVNSIRARLDHVKSWLADRKLDVLLLQELKGTEFPLEPFTELGYIGTAVTQKAYNGVAILARHPNMRHRIMNKTRVPKKTYATVLCQDKACRDGLSYEKADHLQRI